MTEIRSGEDRQGWDDLLLEFAQISGRVVKSKSLRGYRIGGGLSRQWAMCAPAIFDRLVKEGRISSEGEPIEDGPPEASLPDKELPAS